MSFENETIDLNDLGALDAMYENAEAPASPDFEDAPDGKYQVFVYKVELKTAQSGNKYINWRLRIMNGKFAGKYIFAKHMLANKKNFDFLKKDMTTCGKGDIKISEMGFDPATSRLAELLDITLEVQKKTNGDFLNVYFQRKLEGVEIPANLKPEDNAFSADGEYFDVPDITDPFAE